MALIEVGIEHALRDVPIVPELRRRVVFERLGLPENSLQLGKQLHLTLRSSFFSMTPQVKCAVIGPFVCGAIGSCPGSNDNRNVDVGAGLGPGDEPLYQSLVGQCSLVHSGFPARRIAPGAAPNRTLSMSSGFD